MKIHRYIGIVIGAVGVVLMLGAPWLVFSFPPVRHRAFSEGWATLTTGECVWVSFPEEAAVFGWFITFVVTGIAALFAGIYVYRSAVRRRLPV